MRANDIHPNNNNPKACRLYLDSACGCCKNNNWACCVIWQSVEYLIVQTDMKTFLSFQHLDCLPIPIRYSCTNSINTCKMLMFHLQLIGDSSCVKEKAQWDWLKQLHSLQASSAFVNSAKDKKWQEMESVFQVLSNCKKWKQPSIKSFKKLEIEKTTWVNSHWD